MLGRLGVVGAVGLLLVLGGIGLAAVESPLVAGGIALVLLGLGLVAYGLVRNLLGSVGLLAGGPPGPGQ